MGDFAGAGQKPGLEVWRIEKMVPTVWADHGKFCSGDSFIVLKTTLKPGHSSLSWDIHFWLGSETSQDEAGVAAYKTVELDDLLGGAPVQHREVQGHESDKFLSYFKGGVQYLEGGVESGFTKVERDVYETRLLHLKGNKQCVRVSQVEVSSKSLNAGDVFILDCGLEIYQFNGSDANKYEKAKGLDVTGNIKNNERGGRAHVYVVEQGSSGEEAKAFWKNIGGEGPVAPSITGSDEQAAQQAEDQRILFRVSDASGRMEVSEAGQGQLKKDMLDTNDVFILDCGGEVFVWVGKGANPEERKNGMVNAQNWLQQQEGRGFTKLTKVVEFGETPLFKDKFVDWQDFRPPTDFSKPYSSGVAGRKEQKDIDVGALIQGSANPADNLIDDGSGTLKIWRINNFEKEDVPEDLYGRFYAGDSYIVLYTYMQGTKECYMIYFWQGRNSTNDEKGASAILATKLDDELHGAATQVRVVQGKEPLHFLTLFKGSMIIYSGGTASGFKNKQDADSYDTDGVHLFHVKGTNALNTRAVAVEEKAASLNSGDSFILRTPGVIYLWYGSGSSDEEKATALNLAKSIARDGEDITEVAEGSEPDEFWSHIGGKGEYASSKELADCPRDPRLFHVSNATGVVEVQEVYDFSQDDLDPNDVYFLDVYTEVYTWIGSGANKKEKEEGFAVAQAYLDQSSRNDVSVVQIHASSEPPMFKAAFLGWDDAAFEVFEDPYEKKLRLIAEAKAKEAGEEPPAKPAPAASSSKAVTIAVGSQFFPLADLQAKTVEGIDVTQRELYLSDADFQSVFRMDKAAFEGQKKWKKDQLKKEHKLF